MSVSEWVGGLSPDVCFLLLRPVKPSGIISVMVWLEGGLIKTR